MANNNDDDSSSNSNINNLQRLLAAALSRAEAAERTAAAEREAAEQRVAAEREAADQRVAAEREAADQRVAAAERARERRERLNNGTYYSTLNQVWDIVSVVVGRSDFEALRRSNSPVHKTYEVTAEAARNINNIVANEATSSRNSVRIHQKILLWPTDIFGTADTRAEIAHLIPAAASNAMMYDDVAMLAIGLTQETITATLGHAPSQEEFWAVKQKAIHGARPAPRVNKIDLSGLKHSPLNKIRLKSQKPYFDSNPCVVIIPIMSLADMLSWNEEPYEALVLVEDWDDIRAEIVCKAIGMTDDGPEADGDEIETARELLSVVLCGLAFSFLHGDHDNDVTELIAALSAQWPITNVMGGITVPANTGREDVPLVKKVQFGAAGQHLAPDPFLLTVKAAVNWSKRHGQPLLAAGEKDDDIDSLSQQAIDVYLERKEKSYRPETTDDLAVGLGQPKGFQATTDDLAVGLDQADGYRSDDMSINSQFLGDDSSDEMVHESVEISGFVNAGYHASDGLKTS